MAYVRKRESGKFQGIAKSGRDIIGTKTFARKRDALAWAERQEAAAVGGLDVKAGKARVKMLLPEWIEHRAASVAQKTAIGDAALPEQLPASILNRAVDAVNSNDVQKWLLSQLKSGAAHSSVSRRRDSLSAFFSWCVAEKRIAANPVTAAKMPRRTTEQPEMRPLTEDDLDALIAATAEVNLHASRVIEFLAWTGLRWGEARALRVSDLRDVPTPGVRVSRSQSEQMTLKTTKGRAARTVPLPNRLLPTVEAWAVGKSPDDWLITGERGGRLNRNRLVEQAEWKRLSAGRRLHDLRHTAACIWLTRGVDLATVSAWLGHASVSITNKYVHYLGSAADRAALALLNDGGAEGVPSVPTATLEA